MLGFILLNINRLTYIYLRLPTFSSYKISITLLFNMSGTSELYPNTKIRNFLEFNINH